MAHRLAGDRLRVAGRSVVETAKKVFTQTDVATQSVSVNSIGWQAFKSWNLPLEATILMVGAGATNTAVGRFLVKAGYHNFRVVNRSLERAQALADVLGTDRVGTGRNGSERDGTGRRTPPCDQRPSVTASLRTPPTQ